MSGINTFLDSEPYSWFQSDKEALLTDELKSLTAYHSERCSEYGRYLKAIRYKEENVNGISDIPFFPVRMFKELELRSVPREDIIKTTTSSGTTGQKVSQIYIDRETAALQQKITVKQLGNFWGKKRLPFLIVDSEETIKNRTKYSARAAGIMGFRFFATDMVFLLDKDMNLDEMILKKFLDKYGNSRFIIFGFTFMVWQHLYKRLNDLKCTVDMSNAIQLFMDHYGMSEQTGSIYLECPYGHYHASVFSDIIVRNPFDFSPCKTGERGIVQVLSVVPRSYPGHSLLTEDEGEILGIDDCPCGRKGKYVKIHGRIKRAEIRGCSDTYAAGFKQS